MQPQKGARSLSLEQIANGRPSQTTYHRRTKEWSFYGWSIAGLIFILYVQYASWHWKETGDSVKGQIIQIRESAKIILADMSDKDVYVQDQRTAHRNIFTVILLLVFLLAALYGWNTFTWQEKTRTLVLLAVLILYILYVRYTSPLCKAKGDALKQQIVEMREATTRILAHIANQDLQGLATVYNIVITLLIFFLAAMYKWNTSNQREKAYNQERMVQMQNIIEKQEQVLIRYKAERNSSFQHWTQEKDIGKCGKRTGKSGEERSNF